MNRRLTLYLFFALLALALPAQATRKPFPAGVVYLVGGNDPLSFFEGTLSSVFDDPNVDLIRLRITWATIQPTSLTSYSWSRVDNALAVTAAHGKKLGISISAGLYASPGDTSPRYTIDPADVTGTQPIPWNATYKSNWQTFVTAFGARYDANPTLAYIVITGFMQNNEMYLSKTTTDDDGWNNRAILDGYTDDGTGTSARRAAYVPAAEEIIGYFETSFPTTPCILTLARPWSNDTQGNQDKAIINGAMHSLYPGWYGEMIASVKATLPPHDTTPNVQGFPKIGQAVSASNDDTRFYQPALPGSQPAAPQPVDDLLKAAQLDGRTAVELWAPDVTNTSNASAFAADRPLLIANLGAPGALVAPATIVIKRK